MIFKTDYAYDNWKSKYQYKDETPLGTFQRVAKAIAEVEHKYDPSADIELFTDKFLKTFVNFEHKDSYHGEVGPEDTYLDYYGNTLVAIGLKCTPGGRITANAGTEYEGATLLNCYIAPPVKSASISYTIKLSNGDEIECNSETDRTSDNLSNIFLTILEQAETLKSEGGYGMNFGFIRPRSSLVKGVGIKHPGVVSYMDIWDKVSEVIVRGDSSDGYQDSIENHLIMPAGTDGVKKQPRKGAMMAMLPIWHPDIEEFIRSKQRSGRLTKFNISVVIDNAFMEAVEADDFYNLEFKGVVHKRVRARELFNLIAECSYNRAEPGIYFLENAQKNNPMLFMMPYMAANPCGEIGGATYVDSYHKYVPWIQKWVDRWGDEEISGFSTVCLLGSVNLTQYIDKKSRSFCFKSYARDVEDFSRILENVNDIGNCPLPHYQWALENVRQYGMGLNGLGSALIMMGVKYNSPEALEFIERVGRIKENTTLRVSAELARDRGPAPIFSEDVFETQWWAQAELDEDVRELIKQYGLRNMKTTTNPPLGNSSVICDNVTNGPEPAFLFKYDRKRITDNWPDGLTLDMIKVNWATEKFDENTAWTGVYDGQTYYFEPHNRGLCQVDTLYEYGYKYVLDNYPEDIEAEADYLVTAEDLSVEDHIKAQAAIQKHVNQSVSKTVNLPNDYPFEDYKKMFFRAWREGLVGVTAYRSGSMESVLSKAGEVETKHFIELLVEAGALEKDSTSSDATIVQNVKLPYDLDNGPMQAVKKEGNKYYMFMSYLPNDTERKHPVAMWVLTNHFVKGEWTSLRRAVNKMYEFLKESGVDEQLVDLHAAKVKDEDWASRLGKAISMALRHNIPVFKIVKQLENIEGDHIATTLTAVRKFLKQNIEDGTLVDATCMSCGSANVVYEAGCDKCLDCGSSGCN